MMDKRLTTLLLGVLSGALGGLIVLVIYTVIFGFPAP